jgi:hypothetical protein
MTAQWDIVLGYYYHDQVAHQEGVLSYYYYYYRCCYPGTWKWGKKLHGERSVPILSFQGPRRFGVSAPSGLHERWTKAKGRERDGRDTRQGVPCVLIAFGLVCNFRRHFAQSTRKFFVLFRSRIRVGDVLPVGLYCWLRSNGIVGVFNGRWSFSILSWVCSSVHSTHKKE